MDAPLILRASLWPVEMVEGLASPDFAQGVDTWLDAESALLEEGGALADALYSVVPTVAGRSARGAVLALRRALHRDAEPVDLTPVLTLAEVDGTLKQDLRQHGGKREKHRAERVRLEAAYTHSIETECAELRRLAADDRFRKALALASPAAFSELVRDSGIESAPAAKRSWRLTRTLLQFALRAAGRATPNGLWAGSSMESGTCDSGIETEPATPVVRHQPRLALFADMIEFPVAYESAWHALRQALPASEAHTVDRLQALCAQLDQQVEVLTAEEFAAALGNARAIVNEARRRHGLIPAGDDQCVLTADCALPLRFRVSPALKARIERAVRLAWSFDRFGLGEEDAAARRDAEFADGANPPEATALDRWERELAPVYDAHTHRLPATMGDEYLPPGSALLRLDGGSDGARIRLGSITPDPALFYGRFDHLLGAGSRRFCAWYSSALDRIERENAPVRFADLAVRHPSDFNAAARPRFRSLLVDPLAPTDHRITRAPDGRPRLAFGDTPCLVPLVSTAASLHTADAGARKLGALAHLLGRPALLRPLPPLERERTEWHHLPRLELAEDVIISAERWTMPPEVVAKFAAAAGFGRFLVWRRWARSIKLPGLVYAFTGLEGTESLLAPAGTLAVESLGRAIAGHPVELRFQEAFPNPCGSWLQDEHGRHYLAELATAWPGDAGFWRAYTNGVSAEAQHALL